MKKRRLRGSRYVAAIASVAVWMTAGAAAASATTYYVTPNPQPGADCSQANPCDITAGTSVNDAEVVVLPGHYTVSSGLSTLNSANIHGVDGQPRPQISSTYEFAAWALGCCSSAPTITFRHIEIDTTGSSGVQTSGNGTTTIEDVVVRASAANGVGCVPGGVGGMTTIKNALCQGSPAGLGINCPGCNETVTLHNVTAIGATNGISFNSSFGSASSFTVNAFNTIARHTGGTGADVAVTAHTTNSSAVINLDHSNYSTRAATADCATAPCTATITDPATMSNQTAAPMFVNAVGGDFHQAVGSPTIEAGIDDVSNGAADIDGQQRMIGTTDIGADELGRATSTSVGCSPAPLPFGASTTCTATVTDAGPGPTAPTGIVAFGSSGSGSFSGAASCTLAATGNPGQSSCAVAYATAQAGTDQINATAPPDFLHEGSQGAFPLVVTSPMAPPAATPPPSTAATPTTATRCKKKKRAASAKKKRCRKKPRR